MAYSPEAAALILNSCNDAEIAAALQSNPELFARLQNLPKAKAPPPQVLEEMASSSASQPAIAMAVPPPLQVPQALQMGVLPTFGGLPYTAQPIGLMSVPAPPATSQSTATMQVPMAPQPSTASSSTSNFSVPIRGRDVPHRQSRARSQAPGAWHQDRAGNTWQDDRQQSPQDRTGYAWQDRRQQSTDRSWHSWHDDSWHSNWWQGWRDWHSSDRQGWDDRQSPPRGSRAQPNWHDPTESAPHVDVQRDGWQWSYQLDEAIMHSSRGRPYYKNRKSGKFLCAIQCTATHCNHMRPACNFSIRDPENDNHGGHLCSYCRQELEWRKARHEAGLDPVDD